MTGKLSFVGRSGTPSDVRYVAHSSAEMPEHHTQAVISSFAKASTTNVPAKDGMFELSFGYLCSLFTIGFV